MLDDIDDEEATVNLRAMTQSLNPSREGKNLYPAKYNKHQRVNDNLTIPEVQE